MRGGGGKYIIDYIIDDPSERTQTVLFKFLRGDILEGASYTGISDTRISDIGIPDIAISDIWISDTGYQV